MQVDQLIEKLDDMEERKIFTPEEEAALIAMYEIKYPVEFQEQGLTVEDIVALKSKHLRILEEAQQLNPLVTNILQLPAVQAMLSSEEADYV
jgi:hypothetical protein